MRAGEETITKDQARLLARWGLSEIATFRKRHFNNVPLSENQVKALVSLAWSSRWEKKPGGYLGPTLIGPRITQAIREGDDKAVVYEIVENSGTDRLPASIQKGMRNRRMREARMWMGVWNGN